MNSNPVMPLDAPTDDGSEALTPGHLLVGRALVSLPLILLPGSQLHQPHVGICYCGHLRSFGLCGVLST